MRIVTAAVLTAMTITTATTARADDPGYWICYGSDTVGAGSNSYFSDVFYGVRDMTALQRNQIAEHEQNFKDFIASSYDERVTANCSFHQEKAAGEANAKENLRFQIDYYRGKGNTIVMTGWTD